MNENSEAALVKALTARRRPRVLYHYTSASSLIGILQSRAIWTTNIRFLNDSTEYAFALELARDVIQRRADKAQNKFDFGLYTVLLERLTADIQSEVYVSSFTENADQLGQWRAYCPPTGGYAVGFRSKMLVRFPTNEVQRFLTRCVYDGEGQYDLINSLVQVVANFAQDKIAAKLEHDRIFREAFKLFGRLLPLVAPALKDSSFAEEQEWRLVCLPTSFEDSPTRFRAGRSMIIPYHEHSLSDDDTSKLPVEELMIGPTPHPRLAREAAQNLLSSYGLMKATVHSSSIPYRSW
jgi:hypothetical protein